MQDPVITDLLRRVEALEKAMADKQPKKAKQS